MTADQMAGDDDDKFELATFSIQRVKRSGSPLLHFFEAVFFVLSAAGNGTPNIESIQQRLYAEQFILEVMSKRG